MYGEVQFNIKQRPSILNFCSFEVCRASRPCLKNSELGFRLTNRPLNNVTNISKQYSTGWHREQWDFQNNEKTMEHSDNWIVIGFVLCALKCD